MRVGKLKKEKNIASRNDKSLGIQTWGENNDYPQQVRAVVRASSTGKSCLSIYQKFISGRGFYDKDFYKLNINDKGQTNDYLLNQICNDFGEIGGFAIHVNYNANYRITDLQHIPIETLRFSALNDDNEFYQVATHPDWGRQFTQLRKWKKEDIEFFYLFNPDPQIIQEQVDEAGGWHLYKGQVFFYSNNGEKTYPSPVYEPVLTDMNTQEGISNVSNRNARNNFLMSGALVDIIDTDESTGQENETEKSLIEFQGDEEACKMMYLSVKSKEEIPTVLDFKGKNYDKEFTETRASVKEDIGQAFNQPPILRSEDVGANFGADLMNNAYNYYNSVTENERLVIERVFTELFKYWKELTSGNYEVEPLSYDVEMTLAERLGTGFEQLMRIIENASISSAQKRRMAKRLFDLSEEEINDLIPLV